MTIPSSTASPTSTLKSTKSEDQSLDLARIATRHLHSNPPQMSVNAIDAKTTVCIWGRNSGKTETVLAPWFYRRAKAMPRGTSALVSTTYTRLLEMVIPALARGWERLGLEEGVHYWLYRYPDKDLGVAKPYRRPSSPQHCIFWWNGHCTQLISLDRKALSNGLRTQAIGGDECRLWDYDAFAESILPTFGGNAEHFGNMAEYCSMCLVTDMPRTAEGKWLFKYEDEHNEQIIGGILLLQDKVARLKLKAKEAREKNANTAKIEQQVRKWEKWLTEFRKRCVYVSYASTLDNAHTVPLATLRQYRRSLTKAEFNLSVLNKKLVQVEQCFYALLEPRVHGYYRTDYDYVDALPRQEMRRDWRWDGDLDVTRGLDIGLDYNNKCSNLIVGQVQGDEGCFLNHLWALNPLLLSDLMVKFNEYYRDYPTKQVRYIYDHTALITNADDNECYAQKVERKLTELGWEVEMHYIGQATEHQSRYEMWGDFFQGKKSLRFRYNRDTCKHWQIACLQTGTAYKETKKGLKFQKDKTTERSKLIPPYEASHAGEAGDQVAVFWLQNAYNISYDSEPDSMFG